MHYKNGCEAKVGDKVVGRDWQGNPVSGVVTKTVPGATTCNIEVVPIKDAGTWNSSEFLHIDDALRVEPPAVPS